MPAGDADQKQQFFPQGAYRQAFAEKYVEQQHRPDGPSILTQLRQSEAWGSVSRFTRVHEQRPYTCSLLRPPVLQPCANAYRESPCPRLGNADLGATKCVVGVARWHDRLGACEEGERAGDSCHGSI